ADTWYRRRLICTASGSLIECGAAHADKVSFATASNEVDQNDDQSSHRPNRNYRHSHLAQRPLGCRLDRSSFRNCARYAMVEAVALAAERGEVESRGKMSLRLRESQTSRAWC